MKKDGLVLLLLFASGALKDRVCGSPAFRDRVFLFLGNHPEFEKEIREEIPFQLSSAWPVLEKIAKKMNLKPLDYDCVSAYVLGGKEKEILPLSHNRLVMNDCKVFAGVITAKHSTERMISVKCRDGIIKKVKYIGKFGGSLKEGDRVVFHRGYFTGRITAEQEKLL